MVKLTLILIVSVLFSVGGLARQWQDTDLDGVPDLKDACEDTARGQIVDARGCDNRQASTMKAQQLRIMSNLCFATSNGQLFPASCTEKSSISVKFEFAQSQVLMSQEQAFEKLNSWLAVTRVPLLLVGHTDSIGEQSFNQKLSLLRAEQVKKILVEQFGFAANRFQVKGMGSQLPIASNQNAYGREQNRRVEFLVIVQ
ncbi:OmpA family protein [Shewanella schlegeliana]|uniref:OmpA family protein n=1 Tax=Shewanella schlegeliana TaxID=190308 RepID=A0ABS1T0A4_9GAMM|nr:OmpA family protein [Shewanella schlegeliana]MBL4914212.1 OmpA family protein [Shewanella schlegeliana]MCL1111394.1 OmpA family protein [Shewanella schlegeliana]GIU33911.1 membrane protein [Shewanella schlegeliana]